MPWSRVRSVLASSLLQCNVRCTCQSRTKVDLWSIAKLPESSLTDAKVRNNKSTLYSNKRCWERRYCVVDVGSIPTDSAVPVYQIHCPQLVNTNEVTKLDRSSIAHIRLSKKHWFQQSCNQVLDEDQLNMINTSSITSIYSITHTTITCAVLTALLFTQLTLYGFN